MLIPGSSQSNQDRAELVALRRLGTVEDCAKVVEFLATDLSDYVTGAVIPIDGGLVRGRGRTVPIFSTPIGASPPLAPGRSSEIHRLSRWPQSARRAFSRHTYRSRWRPSDR